MNNPLPIFETLKNYNLKDLKGDLFAGLTVGVVLIPQGMAYAVIAGMPPIYGLYASLVPLVIYAIIAKGGNLAVGPVAIDMLILSAGLGMIAGESLDQKVTYAIMITTAAGLIQLAMGGLRLGNVFNLISRPVISGFIISAPIIIIVSQLDTLLGLNAGNSSFIFSTLSEIYDNAGNTHSLTAIFSLVFLLLLILLNRWTRKIPSSVFVVGISLIAVQFISPGDYGISVIGQIPEGLPEFNFQILGPSQISEVFSTALTLALVQFMTVASLSKNYARQSGDMSDPNHELIAVGASNFVGSMFQSLPISASFSRSAIAHETGARTSVTNIISALMILLTLLFLTPVFTQLPDNLLSSVIVVSVWGLIDVKEIKYFISAKRRDAVVAGITFLSVILLGIQEGILIGIAASVLGILIKLGKPTVAELGLIPDSRDFRNLERFDEARQIPGCLILRIDASFSFVNASFFRKYILNKSKEGTEIRYVILDGTTINDMDISAMESLNVIIDELEANDMKLLIAGLIGPVRDVLKESEYEELRDSNRFYRTLHDAVGFALKQLDHNDSGNRLKEYLQESD